MVKKLCFWALVLLPITSLARLGETFAECEARYGPCLRDKKGLPEKTARLIENSARARWDYEGLRLEINWPAP
jgi:hypothetical protein